MTYTARFSRSFVKKFKKLPAHTKPRIRAAIKKLLDESSQGLPLTGNLKGIWKKRVGDYRILYEKNAREKLLEFHTVDLRKKAYQK